jgi:hypothetical protein
MATPGVAVPGTVVTSGSTLSPSGAQGVQGVTGPQGATGATGSGGTGTKTWKSWDANQGNPTASANATWTTRNSTPLQAFNSTNNQLFFIGIVPEGAVVASGVTINLLWCAAATSGNIKWTAAIERMNTTTASDSYDTAGTVTSNANTTTLVPTLSSITPLTTIDGITIGDTFRLLITRDATSTMTGDAQLISCEIRSAN